MNNMDKDTITIPVSDYEEMLAKIAYLESEVKHYQDLALAIADTGYYEDLETKRINAICKKAPIKRLLYNI